jgi:Family of unknown function (DUF6113)
VATQAAERTVLAATYVVLAAIGVLLGVIESFLVPQRIFGGVEGLAVVLAVAGNGLVGTLGGIGTRTIAGAVAPVMGWFVAVAVLTAVAPGGDVVLPGQLKSDPGVTHVTAAFLILGVLAGAIGLVATARYTKRVNPPTPLS